MNVVKTILEVIQKNLLSVICGVIAILACVAVWFWPLPAKFDDMNKKLLAKKAELASLEALAGKTRHYPQIDPLNPETPQLKNFPTSDIIKQGDAIIEQIASESKAVQDLAEKLNSHAPLVAGSLPATSDPVGFEYVSAYQKMMEFQNPEVKKETLPIKVLHAGIPPTLEEVETEKRRRRELITKSRLVPGHNDAEVAKLIAQMELTVADDMKREISSQCQIYMNTDALDVYPGVIGASRAPENTGWAPLVWYSQVGLWVQQDVCEALANANKSSRSVANSPVKHLIKIDVNEAASVPTPTAAPTDAAAAGKKGNLTNRTASGTYDVIPFHLTIYVDAAKVPQVLTELAKNKFITVTKCDLSAVDVAQQALAGYFYGPRPVVMLSLECEELFLKSWTTPLVPPALTAPPAAAQ